MEALTFIVGSGIGILGLCCIKQRKYGETINRHNDTAHEQLIPMEDKGENDKGENDKGENGIDIDIEITKDNIEIINSMLKEYDLCGICNKGYGSVENHIVMQCNHTYHIGCYEPYMKDKICLKCNK